MDKKDKVFLNYYSSFPFQYYQNTSFSKNIDIIYYSNYTYTAYLYNNYIADTTQYKAEISHLNGKVWFVFTPIADESEKKEYLIKYFNIIGYDVNDKFQPKGPDAIMFNIKWLILLIIN